MWRRRALDHSVSPRAGFELHMPKTPPHIKTTKGVQTSEARFHPIPVRTVGTVWSNLCPSRHDYYFMPLCHNPTSERARDRDRNKESEREMCLWLGENPISNVTVCIRCQPMHLNQSTSCQSVWMSELKADGEVAMVRSDFTLMEHGFRVRTINSNTDFF